MTWKTVISSVAPWIGTALGGPLGGMAVSAAADALGLSDKTEAAIKQAMGGVSQADLLALKQADQQFALRMQEIGYQNTQALERIAFEDRDSARNREMATGDRTPQVLVFCLLLAWVIANILLFTYAIPEGNRELLSRALGSLDTLLGLAFAYFYGSTSGGKLKSELLAKTPA